jgi:hypothetical protein
MKVRFNEYHDRPAPGNESPIWIETADVAVVREWRYHSFRPAITEIILKCGEKIHVWERVENVAKYL